LGCFFSSFVLAFSEPPPPCRLVFFPQGCVGPFSSVPPPRWPPWETPDCGLFSTLFLVHGCSLKWYFFLPMLPPPLRRGLNFSTSTSCQTLLAVDLLLDLIFRAHSVRLPYIFPVRLAGYSWIAPVKFAKTTISLFSRPGRVVLWQPVSSFDLRFFLRESFECFFARSSCYTDFPPRLFD